MKYKEMKIILCSLFCIIIVACNGGQTEVVKKMYKNLEDVPESKWTELSKKTIYFGHQSVGDNIIDGIKDIQEELPALKLKIADISEVGKFKDGHFYHSKIGENRKPNSKIKDFEKNLKTHGKDVDIAMLKFCYIDVHDKMDPDALFKNYKASIEDLRRQYPKMDIIHSTVPVTTTETGVKAWIKKVIGKPLRGVNKNIKRYEYNQQLKSEYENTDVIFDIALYESVSKDGKNITYSYNGKKYKTLNKDYTNDGGHLNSKGRRIIAEQLLLSLVNTL